jgi:hypothetical protein
MPFVPLTVWALRMHLFKLGGLFRRQHRFDACLEIRVHSIHPPTLGLFNRVDLAGLFRR